MSGTVYKVGDLAPPPLPRRSEAEVMARWQGDKPVVSILCPTYQHVGFIEDALRGFLGQDTDFPFEILVRDDASTDGTAEIVRDYAERYPNIIRAVLETENRWSEVRPLQALGPMVRGEFIAICEGDDYWIGPEKLQHQVEQLRANPDRVVSHHQALVIADGKVTSSERLPKSQARSHSSRELARGAWTLTLSMVYRNVKISSHPYSSRFLNGDEYLRAQLGLHGGSTYLAGPALAVYRMHSGGIWSLRPTPMQSIDQASSFFWIGWSFAESGHKDLAAWWLGRSLTKVKKSLAESHGVYPKISAVKALSWYARRAVGFRRFSSLKRSIERSSLKTRWISSRRPKRMFRDAV